MIRSITVFLIADAKPIIIPKMRDAPRNAPNTIDIEYDKLNSPAIPIFVPKNKTTIATPRLAPALIPNIPESANGLRKAV